MTAETMGTLYQAIAPKLTNWLAANGTPYQTACDIVQDTFVKLWKKRDELYEDASSVSGLAFTIARNLRIDYLRKGKFLVYEDELRDEAPDPDAAKPDAGDSAYYRRRLDEAFRQLPPLLREAYTLFQVSELHVRDIARLTGASESLVKVRIFRAKQKLRELLRDLDED